MSVIETGSQNVFLIVPAFQGGKRYITATPAEFKEVIENKCQRGITSIQLFNGSNKFTGVSKKKVRQIFSWETEVDLILEKHPYFKTR